jgi:hypothetical protein
MYSVLHQNLVQMPLVVSLEQFRTGGTEIRRVGDGYSPG